MKHVNLISLLLLLTTIPSSAAGFQAPVQVRQSAPAPAPDFSPKGPFLGPLDLPHVVRFRELPMRMYLEPLLFAPEEIRILNDAMVPLFQRVLVEATDEEIQEAAALALARVAHEKLVDINVAAPQLLQVMKSSKSERIQYACGIAAAAGDVRESSEDLIRLSSAGTDAQRMLLEPALARWKVAAAAELWQPRLKDSFASDVAFQLAAEGLSSLNDMASVELLAGIVGESTISFGKRMAAAKAISQLDPEQAFTLADPLMNGSVQDRLLSIALLDNSKSDSYSRTVKHCSDESAAVASAAWQQIFRRQPDLLVDHLAIGRTHRDPQVRMTAARVMRAFATPERTGWLHELLSDFHIEVRNVARQMLVAVGEEHPELKDQVIAAASAALQPDSKDWQGIEQSLVLLGQLKAVQFSAKCIPLLDHPRDEVNISAAWLIHLFPDESIRDQMLPYIETTEALIVKPTASLGELILKQAFLLQYAGLVRIRELQPMLETKLNKMAPGGYQERSAAIYALGILLENNPVPEIVTLLEGRIKDRASVPPEWIEVRRMSVFALGLMRATAALDTVQEAYRVDPAASIIPGTARWVLPLLGQPMPDDLPPAAPFVGGWKINPVQDK